MIVPEISLDEPKRLAQLRALNIMNTPGEERFDRLTRLARKLFAVPVCVVSLMEEDHLWIKSAEGYPRDTCLPRRISFCGHTILQDDVLIIHDTMQDKRFHNHPLVIEAPHFRFYAGCPLRTPGGAKVGSFCIFDSVPREFSEEEYGTLRDLAAMVEAELVAFQTMTSDELTQITNRRGFMLLGSLALNNCLIKNQYACLTFLDLNKFKQINDEYGHREGDRALMDFADAMKVIFNRSTLFARLGGDEFVVLFSHCRHAEAEERLKDLSHFLAAQMESLNRRYCLQFSSGITEFDPQNPHSLEQLLEISDKIMYGAKRKNRNQSR